MAYVMADCVTVIDRCRGACSKLLSSTPRLFTSCVLTLANRPQSIERMDGGCYCGDPASHEMRTRHAGLTAPSSRICIDGVRRARM
jgi:hypothetical protein